MTGDEPRRISPNAIILFVPPPDTPEIRQFDRWVGRALSLAVGSVAAALWSVGDRGYSWILTGAIITLLVLGVLELLAAAANFTARRWRRRVWTDQPFDLRSVERGLLAIWKRPSAPPTAPEILRSIYGDRAADHCVVVCFGFMQVPETVDTAAFEPAFITPMDRQGRQLHSMIAFFVGCAIVWGLSQSVIPGVCGDLCIRGALYGIVPTALIWFWCVGIRPQ
ncbi:MAG: hypothetical protein ACKVS9_02355 [Phycisphaerae bacterium]